jgi:hypothetical protein
LKEDRRSKFYEISDDLRWLRKHVTRDQNKRADWLVSRHLGHSRTLKKEPVVAPVACDHEGIPGWSTASTRA